MVYGDRPRVVFLDNWNNSNIFVRKRGLGLVRLFPVVMFIDK